jgi:hypothetical protein
LELNEPLSVLGILDGLRDLKSLIEITIFVMPLGEIELVVRHLGIILGKLFINLSSI